MKINYMNALTYELIKNENFMPVRDNKGNHALYAHRHVLQLKQQNKLRIAEILDGDNLNVDDIEKHCQKNDKWLLEPSAAGISKIIDIFVFDNYPDTQKKEAICRYSGKDYCLIITDIASRQVISENKSFNDSKYMSAIKKAYEDDPDDHNDLGKSYEIIKAYTDEIMEELHPQKTWATYSIMAVTILLFILDYIVKNLTGEEVFKDFGVKRSEWITLGQYWRLFTPMFLHVDLMHLGSNMLSLYILGQMAEKFFGPVKFTAIYLIGGIMGNIFSYTLTEGISLGASGAVFAIGGAIVLIWKMKASRLLRMSGRDLFLVVLIAINIVMGFGGSGIDNWAHLGGLLGGLLISAGLGFKNDRIKKGCKTLSAAAFLIIALLMYIIGYEKWSAVLSLHI